MFLDLQLFSTKCSMHASALTRHLTVWFDMSSFFYFSCGSNSSVTEWRSLSFSGYLHPTDLTALMKIPERKLISKIRCIIAKQLTAPWCLTVLISDWKLFFFAVSFRRKQILNYYLAYKYKFKTKAFSSHLWRWSDVLCHVIILERHTVTLQWTALQSQSKQTYEISPAPMKTVALQWLTVFFSKLACTLKCEIRFICSYRLAWFPVYSPTVLGEEALYR